MRCRLNPRFSDREVELHYETLASIPREIIPAVFEGGAWYAQMPPVYDDFEYWFVARVYTDAGVMETTLPEGAPDEVFFCDVRDIASVFSPTLVARPLATWPNPCSPQATLSFALAREAPVELAIYNVMGQLQRRLLGGATLPAGGHEVAWDGRDDTGRELSSGIYLVRFVSGRDVSMRRLVLVR
jgi:hypothetical protein